MQFSWENLFFCMKPPFLRHQSPVGDGAHEDTTIQMYWKLCDFSYRYYVNIPHGDATAAGACLHAKKSVRVSECIPMKTDMMPEGLKHT